MVNKKQQRVEVFEDTKYLCKNNKHLKNGIAKSSLDQYIVKENESVLCTDNHRYDKPAEIVVSSRRSYEAASRYNRQKVCVLNFASSTTPGGGVIQGASAQEECLCRCSTLYFNISEDDIFEKFHEDHRMLLRSGIMDARYNDDCIYTPNVIVFKSDTEMPTLLSEEDWYEVDVITCAAPNLRKDAYNNFLNQNPSKIPVIMTDEEIKSLHIKRIKKILSIAKKEKEEVLILGAFGCGAFANPPKVVARAMKEAIKEYMYDFNCIEFAVYCPPNNMENYEVFKETLKVN